MSHETGKHVLMSKHEVEAKCAQTNIISSSIYTYIEKFMEPKGLMKLGHGEGPRWSPTQVLTVPTELSQLSRLAECS